MTTSTHSPAPSPRPVGWRIALVASGALVLAGGSLHPDSDAADPLREELAVMTAHPNWVPGHSLIVLGTVLLVGALYMARLQRVWPRATDRAVVAATVAFAAYAVETVFHLAAAVDSQALHDGHAAPVAFTHIGLAAVLYPVSGIALVVLAVTLGRALGGPARVVAVLGVLGGLAHAVAVPLLLLLPDLEVTPLFAASGVLTALWAIGTGVVGARDRVPAAVREPAPVG